MCQEVIVGKNAHPDQSADTVIVKLTTSFPEWPIERQTSGRKGNWRDCIFLINNDADSCDFWVVYEDLLLPETVMCSQENTLLITAEPPQIRNYPVGFVKQFGLVLSCHPHIKHKNLILRHQAQPWHIGRRQINHNNLEFRFDYDELSSQDVFSDKKKLLSVIVSSKNVSVGHKRRLRLLKALSEHFSERLDVYGRGFREIEDKWDAIRQYKYHLVMENCRIPDYWTEKLSDVYLAGAFPLYYGSPNIGDYFPPESFVPLTDDIGGAINSIEAAIKLNLFENSIEYLKQARNLVLNHYNLFPEIRSIYLENFTNGSQSSTTLLPSSNFRNSLSERISNRVRKIVTARIKPRKYGNY